MQHTAFLNCPPDNMLIPGTASLEFPIGDYEIVKELNNYYIITNGSREIKLSKNRFSLSSKATVLVDGQPEQFDVSLPEIPPFCLVAAWSNVFDIPEFFTVEGEAFLAYDAKVKKHRDILSHNPQYRFNVSLFNGSTLTRKTSK